MQSGEPIVSWFLHVMFVRYSLGILSLSYVCYYCLQYINALSELYGHTCGLSASDVRYPTPTLMNRRLMP
jgi:hypothetical protein